MARYSLFFGAIAVVYIGGFVYQQVGPLFYGLTITLIASTPLLLKISFWKKIILMVPLLVLRVVGKIFLIVFGKNALSKILAKYGLLEKRFNRVIETFEQSKIHGIVRWNGLQRSSQAYLLLIFFPVALVLLLVALLIKIIRLRFLQFIIEKLMQNYLMKWTSNIQSKLEGSNLSASKLPESELLNSSVERANHKEPQAVGVTTKRTDAETFHTTGNEDDSSGDR